MNTYPPHQVVWTAGQLLLPQHFQQQERFLLHQSSAARRLLHAECVGWHRLELDTDGLRRGLLCLRQAVGLFSDGAVVDMPVHSPLPEPLALSKRHVGGVVCVALASAGVAFDAVAAEPSWSNHVAVQTASSVVRVSAYERLIPDDTDDAGASHPTLLGRLRCRLCLVDELSAAEIGLPVTRVLSGTERGEFVLDEQFVPPIVDLRAHPPLKSEVESIVNLVRHRSNWQIDRLNQPQSTSVLETTDFLLLQSLLRHESALSLELAVQPTSPLVVLRHLVALSADMAACSYPPTRIDLPEQLSAQDLGPHFASVLRYLRDALGQMRERLALEIALSPSVDGSYLSTQSLPDIGHGVRIVIAVQAQVPNDWLWQRFADQAIVSASDRLAHRVRLQLPGVRLQHLPAVPPELPLQMGWHYFELERDGQAWAELVQARNIGLHVSGQWPGLDLRGWLLQPRTGQRVAL